MEKKLALTHFKAALITALLAVLGFFAFDVDFYQPKTFAASPAMAAITVNSTAQSPGANGDCTLGEAIQAANANAAVDGCAAGSSGTDTITLPAGTYTFTTAGFIDFRGVGNALPATESDITIQGAGAGSTIIERSATAGTPDFRFFHHSESGAGTPTLTLNDITLRRGRPHDWGGGAIFAGGAGRVVANDCIFSNNQSSNWVGGAISAADVTIDNSTFTGNSALHGGAINTGDGPLTITNSTFTNNAATAGYGGAVNIRRQATISGSTFSNNTASDGGGALSKPGFFEPVIVSNSIFTGNTVTVGSRNGGAISSPNITLTNSTVSGNTATGQGGGVWSNDPTIIGSTISGNTADHGGGVYGQNVTLENSTISGNFARQSGGGLVFNGTSSVLNINNATITNNRADSDNNGSGTGGGIFHTWSFSPSTSKFIRNSIIAGNIHNSAPDCADAFGAVWQSQGYNLIGNNAGCNLAAAAGDQVGTPGQPIDPLLGDLQDNGGATQTHALLANSPAIDTANPATPNGTGSSCLPTDQRIAAIRPGDGDGDGTARCDIGAFEIVQLVPASLAFTVQPSTTTAGQPITPAVQVSILDQFGVLIPNATSPVTIALNNHPGGGTLGGTLTRNAVGGIATFDDLSIIRAANGYTLQATSTSLTAATSNVFAITVGAPARLAFTVQPSNSNAFATITPAIKVAVQDQFGNAVTVATNAVTIATANNPSGNAILSGTRTRNSVNAIATFDDLSLNRMGDGYTLQANAAGLSQAISASFNITRPIFVVTKALDSNDSVCNSDCSLREALTAANALDGADTINFNIAGTPPFVVTLFSSFPNISSPVTIDGTTQPGYAGSPVVGITTSQPGQFGEVFRILAGNSLIKGLQFGGLEEHYFNRGIINLDSDNNTVQGNFIGTDFTGDNVSTNLATGILISGSNNVIGGSTTAERNIISGNDQAIEILGSSNRVMNNFIGTNKLGTAAIPNVRGISVYEGSHTIGGLVAAERNVISGNTFDGIRLTQGATGVIIQGNYIGRNSTNTGNLGNYNGISISAGSGNHLIGGTTAGSGNVISGNTRLGVAREASAGYLSVENLIRNNSIYENNWLGISHLSYGSPAQNDPGDGDSGFNQFQNYPVLTTAELSGGNLSVQGSLNSTPNSTFTLEFFSNTACDPSGYGEGETPIGTTTVTTGASGISGFLAVLPVVPPNTVITATATDAAGNTSEFSQCRAVVGESYAISGQLTKPDNSPLPNTQVKLTGGFDRTVITDSNGHYSFPNLPGANYTVTPGSGIYDFGPPNRTYTVLSGDQTDQNFATTRKAATVSVVVRVDDNGTYYSLGQVTLNLSGAATQSRQTDASGQAFFELPAENNYILTPGFADYTFTPSSVALPNPVPLNHTIEFVATPTTNLDDAGRLVIGTFDGAKTLNANGSGLTILSGTHGSPDLSRDGSRIAYQIVNNSTYPPNLQLATANYDGTLEAALTTVGASKSSPRWSPDRTKIAYLEGNPGNDTDIVIRSISSGATSFAGINSAFGGLTWKFDSTRIAFHKQVSVNESQIFSVDVSGSNQTQLTSGFNINSVQPDWSPDGTKIAFVRRHLDYSIMLINADGSNEATLYATPRILRLPKWSPDGTKIAFLEAAPDGNRTILKVMNADGTGRIELLTDYITSLSWGTAHEVSTPPGTNVPLQSGGVSLNFAGVSSGGQTTVNPIPSLSAGNLPGGFTLSGLAYEITTTATYTPPISICFTVPETIANTQAQFSSLALMHNENGTLVDRTTSRDYPTRQICGTVNSLSPFALAEQIDITKPQISGLVLDSNGDPMSGVQVFLTGEETKEAETDTDGSFRFVNLTPGGNYNVQPKQLGYVFNSYSQDFVNLSGEQTVVFSGTAAGFGISGRVTDSNGNGISNVMIQLNNGSIAETATDAAGNYTVPDLPADGSYAVRAFDGINSFGPSETTIGPLLANVTDVDFTQIAPSAAMVHISGRIMTPDGRGITNATVTLTEADGSSRNAVSSSFGYFRFDDVAAGQNVIVGVRAKRFVFAQPNVVLNIQDSVSDIDFTAEPK